MSFELGQLVGDYEILDILRSSQSTVVYKVRNVVEQRFEVLRVVPGDPLNDQEKVERFLRETKIHARMDHPNILKFHYAGQLENHLVITTEYAEGVTLEERLEIGIIPWPEAAGYIAQVLSALDAAHQLGIVHREVTPSNVFLTPEQTVKLTGFSQARALADPRLTQTGAMVGPLHYMSPEQVTGERVLDGRSDIYSAAVVLYQLVTGRRPFESKIQFEVMLAHVNTPPALPIQLRPDLPRQLNDVILKAMAKDPAARYRSAREFQEALLAIEANGAVPVAQPEPFQWRPQREEHAVEMPPPSAMTEASHAFARRSIGADAVATMPGNFERESDMKLLLLLVCVLGVIAFAVLISTAK